MGSRWHFQSVRSRQVFWFVAVALVPAFSVVGLLTYQRAGQIRGREFEELQIVRDLKVRELNNWLDERQDDLRILVADNDVRALEPQLAQDQLQWNTVERRRAASVRDFFSLQVSNAPYREIFLISATTGQVVISTDTHHEGQIRRHDAYFAEVMKSGAPYIKDIYLSRTGGRPSMTFSAPVYCAEHNEDHIIAVLVVRVDLRASLYPLLQELTGLGETGETLIVNRDAIALNALRKRGDAPLRLKISAEPAVRAARGETGIVETPDYRGERVLAAYTHIPRTGWGFVAKRDLDEVYAPIRSMMITMGLILAILAFLGFLIANYLGRLVARPIVSMAEVAATFGRGDLSARCAVGGSDELDALGRALNTMADTIAGQMEIQSAGVEIVSATVGSASLSEFGESLLVALMAATSTSMGSFYVRSGAAFERVASQGFGAGAPVRFDVLSREGLFGEVLRTRSICFTKEVLRTGGGALKTVAGSIVPREILTVPLLVSGEVEAIVSLANLEAFGEHHHQIVELAWPVLNSTLSSLVASVDKARMADRLSVLNEALQASNAQLQERAQELEEQRTRVETADRLKSEFLANMSHELRTPLNSVLALSRLMLRRGVGEEPEQDSEYVRVIERNGAHLLRLINDLLDLSKIEAGQQDVSIAAVDPGQVALGVLATTGPVASESGLEIKLEVAESLPAFRSDGEKIQQILLNLLSNAIKFSGPGEVTLAVSYTDQSVEFAVSDNGPGLDPADVEGVFEAFRQLDGANSRRHGGTGLGLAIARRLARLLGGEISVRTALGAGSTFTLVLPRGAGSPRQGGSSSESPRPVESLPRSLKVVIASGDLDERLALGGLLEQMGAASVVTVDVVEDVMAAARGSDADLILLDVGRPQGSDFAARARLAGDSVGPRVPTIALSASAMVGDRETILAAGFDAYLSKPIDIEVLSDTIESLLGPSEEVT